MILRGEGAAAGRCRPFGMWRPCDRVGPAVLSGIIIATVFAGTGIRAMAAAKGAEKLGAPLVDWNNAEQAQFLVKQWLKKGKVPKSGGGAMKVSGVIGIRVTLRTDGTFAGSGDAYRKGLSNWVDRTAPATDIMPLVREAASKAFDSVREHLKDARLRAMLTGGQNKKMALPKLSDLADNLQVGVQVGCQLRSIRLKGDAKGGAVYATFAPD